MVSKFGTVKEALSGVLYLVVFHCAQTGINDQMIVSNLNQDMYLPSWLF